VPGIGKSTLLLQLVARLQQAGRSVLYVSGEESREQVSMRAERLGEAAREVTFLPTTRVGDILHVAEQVQPQVLCVDSIQAIWSDRLSSSAGGVAQVRECASLLQAYAKAAGVAAFFVGHVTKGGLLAGPRTLEHLVDVVLHFEGQRSAEHRLLRGSKNRFGSVDELAAFRMTDRGLQPLDDTSALFLSDRPEGVSGSALAVPMHGTRPLVAEVQALSAHARFSSPQRITTGLQPRRLAILLAVLERRAGLSLGDTDVFVSVVGGLRLTDPAADLAVIAALASAGRDLPLPEGTAFVGEVGLGGELRGVAHAEARTRTAARAGMSTIILPAVMKSGLRSLPGTAFVGHVREVVEMLEAP
jgi:DNA repair protein RadA/Sms